MKIVLYVNSFLPAVGGKEIVVHYLAKALNELGHKARVLGPSGWIRHRRHRFGYPVHRWPTLRGRLKAQVSLTQLRLDLALWGGDVVHAHTTYPNGFHVSLLKQKRRIPLVITPHGHDIHVIPELNFGQRLNPLLAPKIEYALRCAEYVTAISGSVKNSIIDAGCDPGKIISVANGIDPHRFQSKTQDEVRRWLGIAPDAPLILSVGNYHPRKGQNVLINAMALVLAQVPKACLVLVGANQAELEKQVSTAGLHANVKLAGKIPFPLTATKRKDAPGSDLLAGLYQKSALYVSASVNKEAEGLSLAMLDAMAAGLPVVATDISGSRDVVKDRTSGLLVKPGSERDLADAICAMLMDEVTATEMGQHGAHIAKDYHWSEIAEQYLAVYHKAIRKQNKG